MFPIFEQATGTGVGYALDNFIRRFDSICSEHVGSKRAKAFAFILYDFHDQAVRRVLKDLGGFAQLDRLSGADLSIFYLHAPRRMSTTSKFNTEFLAKLQVSDAIPPCVVFFKFKRDRIEDVAVAQLDSPDILHALNELYAVIQRYKDDEMSHPLPTSRYLKWLKSGSQFIALEVFREGLKKGLEILF